MGFVIIFLALAVAGRTTNAAIVAPIDYYFTPFNPRSVSLEKRELLSCTETYGEGSEQCGPPGSGFCYNPGLGQSCCETDYGYCNDGSYCAPLSGYCCMDGETLEECADASGFELPANVTSNTHIPNFADPDNDDRGGGISASSVIYDDEFSDDDDDDDDDDDFGFESDFTGLGPPTTTTTTTIGRLGPTPGGVFSFPIPIVPGSGPSGSAGASGSAGVSGSTGASGSGVALPTGTGGFFGNGTGFDRPITVTVAGAPPAAGGLGRGVLGLAAGLAGFVVFVAAL